MWAGDPTFSAEVIQQYVDPTKAPTPEQKAVIEAALRPTLVVAGAGAGKTETMSMRVLWLVANQGIEPERILGLTFTRKAAGELSERLRARLGTLARTIPALAQAGDPQCSTYNAFAQRIVLEHGWRLGFSSETRLLGEAASVQMMSEIVREWRGEDLPQGVSIASTVATALGLAQNLAEHGYTVDSISQSFEELAAHIADMGASGKPDGPPAAGARAAIEALERRSIYLKLIDAFQERKRREGVIDYADQVALATRLVTECPDVVEAIRSEYDAVLLDEFQDTSVIQMTLFSTLFGTRAGKRLAVTAVGDPNQAIYGWRGASAASLEGFLEAFDPRDGNAHDPEQTLTLSTAWRNDHQILTVANALAEPLRTHSVNAKSPTLQSRPGAGRGEVLIRYAPSREAQAATIAEEVARRYRQARSEGKTPTAAILCARRKDFDVYEQALKERDIPTQVIGAGGLLNQPIVRDLRAVLEVASDIEASASLLRLLTGLRLGSADLMCLGEWAKALARSHPRERHPQAFLLEAVDSPPEVGWAPAESGPRFTKAAHERVTLLGKRLRAIRAYSGRGVVEQVERAISIMGLIEECLADPHDSRGRVALDTFVDIAAAFEHDTLDADLPGFLTWLALAETEERGLPLPEGEPDPEAVQIMTIHASKGLEWDIVAVVGMGDGAFPRHGSTSVLRPLIAKEHHYEAAPEGIWRARGWQTAVGELPYDLRGDRAELPAFDDPEGWIGGSSVNPETGKEVKQTFPKWLTHIYEPEVGRYLEREQRRLAYVAVTRARSLLVMSGDWHDGLAKGRYPSIYLHEALATLHLLAEQARSGNEVACGRLGYSVGAPELQGEVFSDSVRAWKALLEDFQRSDEIVQALGEERELDEQNSPEQVVFPAPAGESLTLIEAAADAVLARSGDMRDDRDVLDTLAPMSSHEIIRDAIALIEEDRIRREPTNFTVTVGRLRATAVSALLEDDRAFALSLRRPLPARPSSSATLGTLIHAWVERQLRQRSGELWMEPVEGVELLSEKDAQRLARMQEHFMGMTMPGQPVAVEESFAVGIAGVTVQGRIDAVFSTSDGRSIVVDWKSGRVPTVKDVGKLRYFLHQLRLYQQAWSLHSGQAVDRVDAQLVFLEHNRVLSIDEISAMLVAAGESASQSSLDEALALILSDDDER